jgi:hypothetical protein
MFGNFISFQLGLSLPIPIGMIHGGGQVCQRSIHDIDHRERAI